MALIRTLSTKPDILLLDEPFSALDENTRKDVAKDIYKILRKENKGVILVTHDIEEAVSVSDKIIILSNCPSYIKAEIILPIEGDPTNRKNDIKFNTLINQIKSEIESNVQ